ncbi:MAG: hypothetical protein WCG28_00980 [bacterium]
MKKIIPYIFILLILVGLFSPMVQVNAEADPQNWYFTYTDSTHPQATFSGPYTESVCKGQNIIGTIVQPCHQPATPPATATQVTPPGNSTFQGEIDEGCNGLWNSSFTGCLLKFVYYTIFQLPSLLLWLSAQFFDVMINLGISSSVTSASGFIPAAWAIVRDISNIFFILILLYVAIQTILGMGHETKKIIVRVIIIALLINFSMFFTKIIIDSSNILALVFYNKLDVGTRNANGTDRPSDPALQGGKDIAGGMWKTFDATRLITSDTIRLLGTTTVNGVTTTSGGMPFALKFGIMVIAGSIMLFAAYTFFIAGLMFIGRLIELWVLIIFSPFAFMSWPLPALAGAEYLGWNAWLKRLIATSFMAPIFMFFIYLIFMLLPHMSTFTRGDKTTILGVILGILIPAIIVMALLLKATDFAKKGGGQFGELVLKGASLAIGATAAAVSGGETMAVGGLAANVASSKGLQEAAKQTGFGGTIASLGLKTAKYGSNASFDIRNAPGMGSLAKAGGLNLGKANEGGYMQARAEKVKKRQERAKQLEVGEDEEMKQKLNKSEEDLQGMLNAVAKDFEEIDHKLANARQEKNDLKPGTKEHNDVINKIAGLKQEKTFLKEGKNRKGGDEGGYKTASGNTIKQTEGDISTGKAKIIKENRDRQWAYANRSEKLNNILTGGKLNKTGIGRRTVTEANHKIRMETKIKENKEHGGDGHKEEPMAHPPIASPATPSTPHTEGGEHGGGEAHGH